MNVRTTINFGTGQLMQVGLDLEEVVELLGRGLKNRTLVEFAAGNGETIAINPFSVTMVQTTEQGECEATK